MDRPLFWTTGNLAHPAAFLSRRPPCDPHNQLGRHPRPVVDKFRRAFIFCCARPAGNLRIPHRV